MREELQQRHNSHCRRRLGLSRAASVVSDTLGVAGITVTVCVLVAVVSVAVTSRLENAARRMVHS